MNLARLVPLLLLAGCIAGSSSPKKDKTPQEIRADSAALAARSTVMVDTGSRGKPHHFDPLTGVCSLCGRAEDEACSAEACPAATEGWTSKVHQ